MLDRKRLKGLLPVGGLGRPLHVHRRIGSTNQRALELAKTGAPHGTLVAADEQTAGRGRAGKAWITPPNSALAFSVVLRPAWLGPQSVAPLNALGALAVSDALAGLGASPQIKWPNDVLLHRRKVAGVLVEGSWVGPSLECVVLGSGVNVRPASLPGEGSVDFVATCVDEALGRRVEREGLLAAILERLASWLEQLGSADILQAWESRLAFKGEEVCLQTPEGEVRGTLLGLAENGCVRVRLREGQVLRISGEGASLRPVDRMP